MTDGPDPGDGSGPGDAVSVEDEEPDYRVPGTVAAAREALADAEGDARVVAGGQTLSLLVREGLVDPDAYVDVSGVPDLSGVAVADGRATVGATTTYADLAAAGLSDRVAALADACSVIGDRQVRTLGTVGGALCHADPALDLPPVLACLEADLRVGSTDGTRTVPVTGFLRGHGETALESDELLETVAFDLPAAAAAAGSGDAGSAAARTGSAYEKHAAVENGWPAVGAAARVDLVDGAFETARVGLAAVADTTVRAPSVEDALAGQPVTDSAVAAASEAVTADVDPTDGVAGSAEYKRRLAPTMVERALGTAVRRAGGAL